MEKKQHGGKREGAGRKEKQDKKVSLNIKIKPENLDWLNKNIKNKSKFIDDLIEIEKNKKN